LVGFVVLVPVLASASVAILGGFCTTKFVQSYINDTIEVAAINQSAGSDHACVFMLLAPNEFTFIVQAQVLATSVLNDILIQVV
jgi:hypothetical protein